MIAGIANVTGCTSIKMTNSNTSSAPDHLVLGMKKDGSIAMIGRNVRVSPFTCTVTGYDYIFFLTYHFIHTKTTIKLS